jgi:hypothetical protein
MVVVILSARVAPVGSEEAHSEAQAKVNLGIGVGLKRNTFRGSIGLSLHAPVI